MAQLTITKTYQDGVTPTQLDFDNICDSIESFLNITKLGSDNITNNSITASSTFEPLSITTTKIASDAVTTAKILDSAVSSTKVAYAAVTTAKILDSNVTTAKIADSAVTSAKIEDSVSASTGVTAAKKPLNVAVTSSTTTVLSTGAIDYGSQATSSLFQRPRVMQPKEGSLNLSSIVDSQVMSANFLIQKDSSSVVSQDFLSGPWYYTAGRNTQMWIPSSSAFHIENTDSGNTAVSSSYRNAVDLITGNYAVNDENFTVLEII